MICVSNAALRNLDFPKAVSVHAATIRVWLEVMFIIFTQLQF